MVHNIISSLKTLTLLVPFNKMAEINVNVEDNVKSDNNIDVRQTDCTITFQYDFITSLYLTLTFRINLKILPKKWKN